MKEVTLREECKSGKACILSLGFTAWEISINSTERTVVKSLIVVNDPWRSNWNIKEHQLGCTVTAKHTACAAKHKANVLYVHVLSLQLVRHLHTPTSTWSWSLIGWAITNTNADFCVENKNMNSTKICFFLGCTHSSEQEYLQNSKHYHYYSFFLHMF